VCGDGSVRLLQNGGETTIKITGKATVYGCQSDLLFLGMKETLLVTEKERHFAHELCEMFLEMAPLPTMFSGV
jgi:hypothetical protein